MSVESPPHKYAKLDHPTQPPNSATSARLQPHEMSTPAPARKRLGLGTSTAAGKVKQLTFKPKGKLYPLA